VNLADAVHEKARRHFLEDDAADAEPDGLDQGLVVDHGRQEHHARRQALAAHLPQDGDAVGSGHAEIQDQDIRAMLRDGAQRFDAIGAAIDHVDVRLAAQSVSRPASTMGWSSAMTTVMRFRCELASGTGLLRLDTDVEGRNDAHRRLPDEEVTKTAS
jgi:hypothetical protein